MLAAELFYGRQTASVTGTEKLLQTSAMKRSSRRRVAVEGVHHGESPCSKGRAEETYSYKTPKRSQASRSRLPTFSSPTNEIDMQQEIFWDPQSPVTYKLGNNKKKQSINRHTVEISEIVNRIAPQDEKPACYEGSLLGLWIGEDAIPCTPGITKVRSRTKINVARDLQLKNGEEELMKLAKQFDKNLTDATQEQCILQPNALSVVSEAKLSTEHQGKVPTEDKQWLDNEHPENNEALSLEIPRGSAETFKNPKRSSQKSVDPDVEGALNNLFDCSTQKCSGQLSQGVSNCSSNSVVQEEGILLEGEHLLVIGGRQRQGTTLLKPILAEKAKIHSKQTVPGADFPKIGPAASSYPAKAASDDSDDWDADSFPDDSFLIQITEEPKLMKTEENTAPSISKEKGESEERTTSSKIAQAGGAKSSGTVQVLCAASTKQNIWTGKGKVIPLHVDGSLETNKVNSFSKNRQNNPLDYCIAVKSENRSIQQNFTQLKCAANTTSPIKRTASFSVYSDLSKHLSGKLKGHVRGTESQASIVSTNIKPHDPKSASNHGSSGYLKQTSVAKTSTCSYDDWKEPKFSDEFLEVFDESTCLGGTHWDDDDLLYQVCDDVEKNTLSQMGMKETGKAKLMKGSTSNLQTDLCHAGSNQGLSIYPQVQKSHTGRKTFSLDPPVTTQRNENSANNSARLEDNFSSGTGAASVSRQNGLQSIGKTHSNRSINQMSFTEKSKDVFKTNSSQALIKGHKNVNIGSLSGTNLGLWESKNRTNVPFQNVMSGKPDFKRHLSIDFAPHEKEHKSRRCSQEEIARKKQEAIERRKCKTEALLKNTAPT